MSVAHRLHGLGEVAGDLVVGAEARDGRDHHRGGAEVHGRRGRGCAWRRSPGRRRRRRRGAGCRLTMRRDDLERLGGVELRGLAHDAEDGEAVDAGRLVEVDHAVEGGACRGCRRGGRGWGRWRRRRWCRCRWSFGFPLGVAREVRRNGCMHKSCTTHAQRVCRPICGPPAAPAMAVRAAMAAMSAAATGTAARPKPRSMTRPPRKAPPALPRLKAPMLMVEARLGASVALSTTRVWKAGDAAEGRHRPEEDDGERRRPCRGGSAAARGGRAVSAASMTIIARITPRSENLPPRVMPMVRPTPIISRIGVTLRRGEAGDVLQDRHDVGEEGEDAGRGEDGGRDREEHVGRGARTENSRREPAVGSALMRIGDEERDRDERDHAEAGDEPEGRAPAEALADEGAEAGRRGCWRASGRVNIRPMALARLPGGHDAGRDHRADAEERAVGEGGERRGRRSGRGSSGAMAERKLPRMKMTTIIRSTCLRGRRAVARRGSARRRRRRARRR